MKFHHFDDTTFKGTDAQLKRKETEKNEQSRETLGRRLIFLKPSLTRLMWKYNMAELDDIIP